MFFATSNFVYQSLGPISHGAEQQLYEQVVVPTIDGDVRRGGTGMRSGENASRNENNGNIMEGNGAVGHVDGMDDVPLSSLQCTRSERPDGNIEETEQEEDVEDITKKYVEPLDDAQYMENVRVLQQRKKAENRTENRGQGESGTGNDVAGRMQSRSGLPVETGRVSKTIGNLASRRGLVTIVHCSAMINS